MGTRGTVSSEIKIAAKPVPFYLHGTGGVPVSICTVMGTFLTKCFVMVESSMHKCEVFLCGQLSAHQRELRREKSDLSGASGGNSPKHCLYKHTSLLCNFIASKKTMCSIWVSINWTSIHLQHGKVKMYSNWTCNLFFNYKSGDKVELEATFNSKDPS